MLSPTPAPERDDSSQELRKLTARNRGSRHWPAGHKHERGVRLVGHAFVHRPVTQLRKHPQLHAAYSARSRSGWGWSSDDETRTLGAIRVAHAATGATHGAPVGASLARVRRERNRG